MEDSNQKQQQRVQKIFAETIQEEKKSLDDLDKKGGEFTQQVNSLQTKLFEYVKKKCSEQYKWIEENGKVLNGPEGLRFQINKDAENQAQEKIEAFQQCTDKNDFGMKNFFNEVNQKQTSLQRESEECLSRSIERSEDKTDKDLKNSFRDCMRNTFDETFRLFNRISSKIEEINYKI